MLLIYSADVAWTDGEREQCYGESIRLTRELHGKGQYRGTSPLPSVATGTSVRVHDGKRFVTDARFAETRAQLGGYIPDRGEGPRRGHRHRRAYPGARVGTVEIRPFMELAGSPSDHQMTWREPGRASLAASRAATRLGRSLALPHPRRATERSMREWFSG
jgi:hypothetical protein